MRKLFFLSALLALVPSVQAATKKPVTIKLQDVVKQVRNRNYKVQTATMRTYLAKANIEKSRSDLLPRLTIWELANIAIDPKNIASMIPDIAPFLVPNNWIRLEENKILYLAEQEGYRALWANEVHVTKALYARVLFDKNLLAHISSSVEELQRVHRILETHETFGGVRPGSAREIEIKLLGLREDQQSLKLLISQEINELSYALGIKADVQMVLAPVALPKISGMKPLNYREYEARAISLSPERLQYNHFLDTLEYIRQEVNYSFFGNSPISRGAAGGIFDSIPATSGLFQRNATMKIVDTQRAILMNQREGIIETIRRQLRALANEYNSDLLNFSQYERRRQLSIESNDALLRRVSMGEPINALEFSDNVRTRIQAETALLTLQYRFFSNVDRFQRMMFTADYSK